MGFNEFISKLFGNKAQRDMKEMMPILEKIKAVYPQIEQLDNDGLRTRTRCPDDELTCTPAIEPSNDCETLETCNFWSSSPFTDCAEPVKAFLVD